MSYCYPTYHCFLGRSFLVLAKFYESEFQSYISNQLTPTRSCLRRWSVKKVFLKFRKFHRKTPVLESLFHKVKSLKACNFIKRNSNTGVFQWKFTKFLRTPILKNIYERLFLFFFEWCWSKFFDHENQPPELFCKERCF